MQAIGRSRGWLGSILSREAASFDELATAEALAERHVRFLMPLAKATGGAARIPRMQRYRWESSVSLNPLDVG
jgi:hypothetical protein